MDYGRGSAYYRTVAFFIEIKRCKTCNLLCLVKPELNRGFLDAEDPGLCIEEHVTPLRNCSLHISYVSTILNMMLCFSGICIARSLQIPREIKPETFENIFKELIKLEKAKVVVLFVNEDNCKRLINASRAMGQHDSFYFLASDSWGAKVVPVQGQEWAADGTVTILPQRKRLIGKCNQNFKLLFKGIRNFTVVHSTCNKIKVQLNNNIFEGSIYVLRAISERKSENVLLLSQAVSSHGL